MDVVPVSVNNAMFVLKSYFCFSRQFVLVLKTQLFFCTQNYPPLSATFFIAANGLPGTVNICHSNITHNHIHIFICFLSSHTNVSTFEDLLVTACTVCSFSLLSQKVIYFLL